MAPDTPPSPGSVAVLVISCDKYADLWPIFFALFQRFWPDCPYPVYLVSNSARVDISGVQTLQVGPDVSWSANLQVALESIREEYLLMFLDDLFLVGPVDSARLQDSVHAFIAVRGQCLKLNPTVPGNVRQRGPFKRTSVGTAYRASTVLTLWSRPVLRDLLRPEENAWEFELNGSMRSDKYLDFFAAKRAHFSFVNGVIKGRWSRRAWHRICSLLPSPPPTKWRSPGRWFFSD